MIRKYFDEDDIELKSITKLELADFEKYNAFILGTPTLGEGELPENWDAFLATLPVLLVLRLGLAHLASKRVADKAARAVRVFSSFFASAASGAEKIDLTQLEFQE